MTKKEQERLLADLVRENKNLKAQVRYYKAKAAESLHYSRQQTRGLFSMPYLALGAFVDEWYFQMESQLRDEYRFQRTRNLLHKYLGGPEGASLLGQNVNLAFGNVLARLGREMKDLRPEEEALFCYMAARMDNLQIGRLLEIGNLNTVSSRKNRLRAKIIRQRPDGREEYLELIDKKNK